MHFRHQSFLSGWRIKLDPQCKRDSWNIFAASIFKRPNLLNIWKFLKDLICLKIFGNPRLLLCRSDPNKVVFPYLISNSKNLPVADMFPFRCLDDLEITFNNKAAFKMQTGQLKYVCTLNFKLWIFWIFELFFAF